MQPSEQDRNEPVQSNNFGSSEPPLGQTDNTEQSTKIPVSVLPSVTPIGSNTTPTPVVNPVPINPQISTAQPVSSQTPGTVLGEPSIGNIPPATALTGKTSSKKKKIIIGASAASMLLILGVGFVFGYHVPNQPQNVWKTGLSRTADELDAFINKASDPATFETLSKNKMTVSGKVDVEGANITADLNTFFDESKSDSTLKFNAKDSSGFILPQELNINAKIKSENVEGSVWPNIYFNISGFSSLGLDEFVPGISEFEGKWISVEQDFYNETLAGLTGEEEAQDNSNITQQDIVSVLKDINTVTKEYVFTDNPEKAVIIMKEFVGTEESEGIKANHYKATIHKDNSVKYCKALAEKLFSNESFRKVEGVSKSEASERKDEEIEACDPPKEGEEDEYSTASVDPFDIWIDKKYKILHKVRVYEDLDKQSEKYKEKKAECEKEMAGYDFDDSDAYCDYYDDMIVTGEKYTEIGQIYNGNEELKLFVNYKGDTNQSKDDFRSEVSIKLDGLVINGKLSFKTESEMGGSGSGELTISTEAYDGEIDSSKPEDSTPIMDVWNYLQSKRPPQGEITPHNDNLLGESTDNTFISKLLNGFN